MVAHRSRTFLSYFQKLFSVTFEQIIIYQLNPYRSTTFLYFFKFFSTTDQSLSLSINCSYLRQYISIAIRFTYNIIRYYLWSESWNFLFIQIFSTVLYFIKRIPKIFFLWLFIFKRENTNKYLILLYSSYLQKKKEKTNQVSPPILLLTHCWE